MLKLGAAEVLDSFERSTVFKGKTRERNIRGGKSVAFPLLAVSPLVIINLGPRSPELGMIQAT